MSDNRADSINLILEWYEKLTPESLLQIDSIYTEDAYFKDPFNEFKSREKIKNILNHMFEKLEKPRFVFIDKVVEGESAFFTWDFKFSMSGKEYCIHGSSFLKIKDQKIYYHRDYWDVGEELLSKIPVIKWFYNKLAKKLGE